MFTGLKGSTVERLMEIMRNRDIDRFNISIIKELTIVIRNMPDSRYVVLKPSGILRGNISTTNSDNFRPDAHLRQMKPTGSGTGEFTPHHAAANYSKAYSFHSGLPIRQIHNL